MHRDNIPMGIYNCGEIACDRASMPSVGHNTSRALAYRWLMGRSATKLNVVQRHIWSSDINKSRAFCFFLRIDLSRRRRHYHGDRSFVTTVATVITCSVYIHVMRWVLSPVIVSCVIIIPNVFYGCWGVHILGDTTEHTGPWGSFLQVVTHLL